MITYKFSRLIGYFVITQRKELYKVIFLVFRRGVQENCLLGIEKSCTDLVKVFCQVLYKVLVLGVKSQG